ncbi:MAG: hypothetical protein ACOYVF_03435, partial [Candidatus Zixiibacteriota bacterium]
MIKQHEAVINVMDENGGYATLVHLYQHVLKVPDCSWETKTPFASIRRIVQDERFFFKIRPGLWALKSRKNEVLKKLKLSAPTGNKEELFDHTYYQGLLVEIGNLEGFETFVPNQDKNKQYLNHTLKEITSLKEMYIYSYPEFMKRSKTIDVTWFNKRKMPHSFYEVEHTTEINNSLFKFVDLQDFNVNFHIVADISKKREFIDKINRSIFEPIRDRVKFIDYDKIS